MKHSRFLIENTLAVQADPALSIGYNARWFIGISRYHPDGQTNFFAPCYSDLFDLAQKFDFRCAAEFAMVANSLAACQVRQAWFDAHGRFLYLEDLP